jgi:succinate dehydrogenase/fumarate reductase flavoprotein subunit
MKRAIERVLTTDLLSIGGSGAGVTAAIYAFRQGVRVTLVSKGKIGYSGNAIMAGGGFGIDGQSGAEILGYEDTDKTFTKDKMFDCLVKESFFIADQNMVQQYVDDAPYVMKDYLAWAERAGCDFIRTSRPCGWMSAGLEFAKPFIQGLKETPGIEVLEDVAVVEILTRDGAVTGALAVDVYTGEMILIEAKAVVVGTGGYQPFSLKNTVSDMTGDGPAMAYRAGAMLTDMEFMLAFPTAVVPQDMKGSIYPFIFEFFMPNLRFTIRDKNGCALPMPDEILRMTRGTKLSKLANSFYMGHAIDQGLGGPNGGAFYDYSAFSREEKDESFKAFFDRFGRWHKYGSYKGESLKRVQDMINNNELLEVGLGFEYCMGGIEINAKMETSVRGLFAAGEATSGVFGACRAGDGMTEMLCQGMRAGLTAADFCRVQPQPQTDLALAEEYVAKIAGYFDNTGGISPITLYNSMEQACDSGFSVIRCEEGLKSALSDILQLKQEHRNVTIRYKGRAYNNEWMRAIQAENMLTCCEAGIRAAIARKESRGCHIRKDYPEVDHDNYLIKYVFSRDGAEMKTATRKPVVTRLPLPAGKRPDVIQYFLDKSLHYKR